MALQRKKQTRAKGDHTLLECNHTVNGVPIHYHPEKATENKPFVVSEAKQLIIPSTEPLAIPGILPKSDFDRLKAKSKVVTKEDRNKMIQDAAQRKKELHIESEKRRETLRLAQNKTAERGAVLEEAENDAIKKNQYMLQRAAELQTEQMDEIKTLNGIILASKCLAIREAQINEKKIIEKELEEEDRRLDMMMEQNRQRLIIREQKQVEEAEKRTKEFVVAVKQQLKANEIQTLAEREKREEEARNSNKLLIAFEKHHLEEIEQKKKKQIEIRDDFRRAHEEAIKFKALKEAEERALDMRMREFMERKQREEDERIAQAAMEKQCKEADSQRIGDKMREQQELQEKGEEMRIFRIQEEIEREWRRKEKDAALKRKIELEKLKEERMQQIKDIRKARAREIARDQEQFFKVCDIHKEKYEQEQEKAKEDKIKALKNRYELLKQVNFKEQERIDKRRLAMEEGEAIRLENEMRKVRLNQSVNQKLDGLKEYLPEKTVQDIRRQSEKLKARLE